MFLIVLMLVLSIGLTVYGIAEAVNAPTPVTAAVYAFAASVCVWFRRRAAGFRPDRELGNADVTHRGTSNTNQRGSAKDRARRMVGEAFVSGVAIADKEKL